MIRLSHYPTHLIKIYCTELNLLSSILQYSHRGQRMLLKVVSSGKIRVFMLCLWTCENMCACTMSNPTTLSSLQHLRCSDSDNVSSVDYIPPLLPATFKFNHCGSAVVQILWDPALPVITQTVIEFWKNLEVEPSWVQLLPICLWLVWPGPLSWMHFVVCRPCLTWERQEPFRWDRRGCLLNKVWGL